MIYAIGEALTNWSLVETELLRCFEAMTEIQSRKIALTIHGSIINMDARLKLMNRLMGLCAITDDGRDTWPWLYNRLTRANKARNEVAHGGLIHTGGDPETGEPDEHFLVPFFASQGVWSPRLTIEQVCDRARRFWELLEDISWLNSQFPQRPGSFARSPEPAPARVARHLQTARSGTKGIAPPPQPQRG
jgi:hypothetical protein